MSTAYAPWMPNFRITAAPMNGPMKAPIRLTPPSVDMARARRGTGTTTAMYDWRARLKIDDATPMTRIDAASNPMSRVSRQPSPPKNSSTDASSSARFSPNRAAIAPAGTSPIS